MTAQRYRKAKIGNELFEIYYHVGSVVYEKTTPAVTVEYKIQHNGKNVLASIKGKNAWVVPPGIDAQSDLAYVLMMDALTNEMLIEMHIAEEEKRGKKSAAKVALMKGYMDVSHLWWNNICDAYPAIIEGLEKATNAGLVIPTA